MGDSGKNWQVEGQNEPGSQGELSAPAVSGCQSNDVN